MSKFDPTDPARRREPKMDKKNSAQKPGTALVSVETKKNKDNEEKPRKPNWLRIGGAAATAIVLVGAAIAYKDEIANILPDSSNKAEKPVPVTAQAVQNLKLFGPYKDSSAACHITVEMDGSGVTPILSMPTHTMQQIIKQGKNDGDKLIRNIAKAADTAFRTGNLQTRYANVTDPKLCKDPKQTDRGSDMTAVPLGYVMPNTNEPRLAAVLDTIEALKPEQWRLFTVGTNFNNQAGPGAAGISYGSFSEQHTTGTVSYANIPEIKDLRFLIETMPKFSKPLNINYQIGASDEYCRSELVLSNDKYPAIIAQLPLPLAKELARQEQLGEFLKAGAQMEDHFSDTRNGQPLLSAIFNRGPCHTHPGFEQKGGLVMIPTPLSGDGTLVDDAKIKALSEKILSLPLDGGKVYALQIDTNGTIQTAEFNTAGAGSQSNDNLATVPDARKLQFFDIAP
ncbi:MAG: hypothetical protein KDJ75_07990 [Alphaproteobacteria bacterium]|nr:hypothetical protein [Alphaproteobacteria bacterium]